MRRYRILHVIDSLGHGGAEHQLVLNLSALDRARFENHLCYLRPVNDLGGAVLPPGVNAFSLGIKGRGEWLGSFLRLWRFVRSQQIDLVHTCLFESDLLGGAAGWLAGVPVVTTFTTIGGVIGARQPDGRRVSRGRLTRAKWLKLRSLARLKLMTYRNFFSHYVAISEPAAHTWAQSFGIPRDRITLIPRAFPASWPDPDPDDLVAALRAELRLDGAHPILISVGRLVPHKGHKNILLAMPDILRNYPRARLLLVGDGRIRGELSSLREKLGLNDSVRFLGKRSDVKLLLQLSDMFIFPSLSEGFGVALLEAAALGKPCVVSGRVPLAQTAMQSGESALLVDPLSPESIAEAVLYLASRPEEAQAMGRRAKEIVLSRFTLERAAAQLETLYEDALGECGPARRHNSIRRRLLLMGRPGHD